MGTEYKETEMVELKKSTSELKEAVISISAILNKHQKGEVYFGIKNDGTIIGQDISEQTIRAISRIISDNIEPKIYPKISKINLDGAGCVHVVFQGSNIPYYAYGRAYMRVGDEDRQLSAKELESMILKKNKDKLRWDIDVCKDAKLSDIDETKIKSFVKTCGLTYINLSNTLEKLKLVSDGMLLNAAVILFGKEPQSFFPNAKLRCAVFSTTDTAYPVDMKDFEGDLFSLIEEAEKYILKNIHIGMKLEGLRRADVPEIDNEAFREAIINAFCHRDYCEYDSVNIAIFTNRVEVRSPGLLYGGLTIDRIKREMVSERRNELIADMFHRVHLIEKWGRGINLILSRANDTVFKEVGRHFIVVFKRNGIKEVTEKVTEKVTENQKKILKAMAANPHITAAELSGIIGISERKVKENIKKLKEKGLLRRIGPDKGGRWEVVDV